MGIANDPLYLVYNSAKQKNLFSVFFTFRDIYIVKVIWDFRFYRDKHPEALEDVWMGLRPRRAHVAHPNM
jgi:hypothetical protein